MASRGQQQNVLVKLLLVQLLIHLRLSYVEPNVINLEDMEAKLNQILDAEVEEKSILKKLSPSDTVRGQRSNSPLVKVRGGGESRGESVGILNELVETSGRMEWLVGLLADLKTMLNQALDSQQKQLSLRTEVSELRDEIKYLREEVQLLKRDQVKSETFQLSSKVQTKLENDEKKIEWLTTGLEEIRHELREVSSSFNVTTLFQLTKEAENEAKSTKRNLDTFQKDLERLEVAQAQTTQDLVEIRGDLADMRKNEANFGTRLAKSGEHFYEGIRTSEMNLGLKLTKAEDQNGRRRHDKKRIRSQLNILGTTVNGIMSWTAGLEQKLDKLEARTSTQGSRMSSALDDTDYTRLMTLETSLAETQNHLNEMKADVTGVAEIRESSQTLFKVLEALETKYDGRMTEFQEKLSHLEVITNDISITQEDAKQAQAAQWRTARKYKQQVQNNEHKLQETHLRVTALQTHILQWGMKTCANEMREKSQDLRIIALEKALDEKHNV